MGVIADKIRKAIFGSEVRDSIADGIEVVEQLREDYDNQVINAGNSNAEIVDARGGHIKLKDRLDQVDSHLDNKANKLNNKLHFISSINTGDCTVIQLSDGKNILIDSHHNSNAFHTLEYINSLDIDHFDYVIITHYHSDHIGNIQNLHNFFDENTIFYLPQDVERDASIILNQDNVKGIILAQGSKSVQPTENQILNLQNGVIIEFLNTDHSQYYNSSNFDYNNCSLCFYFKCNNIEMFFSGDIGLEAQEYLKDKVRPVDIYKAHHHSSDKFLDTEFITAIQPKICICMDSNDIHYELIATSRLQNWLQSNSIPIYPTSRNGDITLLINESGYTFGAKCKAFTTMLPMYRYFDDKYVKKFVYQKFNEILGSYNHETSLIDLLNAMAVETTIQTTIPNTYASCPSFISTYGAYITIEKSYSGYCRIILSDRNPSDNRIWLGKWYESDSEVTWIELSTSNQCKFRTGGYNYPVNVETKGAIIADYTKNNNGRYILTNENIVINKEGWYNITAKIVANCKYPNSEVKANIYKNNSLLFSVVNPASLTGFTYASLTELYQFSLGDVIEIRFVPTTSGASEINISSTLIIEEV